MAQKTMKYLIAFFALFMFMSLANALSITTVSPSTLSQSSGSFNVTVDSNSSLTINLNSDASGLIFGSETYTVFGSNTIIRIPYETSAAKFNLGKDYSVSLNVSDGTNNVAKTIPFEETTYCSGYENDAEIELEIKDISVRKGYGDDDDYWFLRDTVEIEVLISNEGDFDVEDLEIEWKLYTDDGKMIMEDSEDEFDLDEGDEEEITFTFTLDEDIDDFEDKNVVLYVRAIGRIDDKSDYDGDKTCGWDKTREIEVITDDDFVIAGDFEINGLDVEDELFSETVSCGQEIEISGKIWNIGDRDQDDVYLEIYSKELKIYERIDFEEVEAFDYESFSHFIVIPAGLDEKTYKILYEVYDEDNDLYENSEDGTSKEYLYIKVEGNCQSSVDSAPLISAEIKEDAIVAGKQLTVETSITNKENKEVIYTFVVEGYESWSELNSMKPEVLSLKQGETKLVEFNFDLKKDALGEKTFKINVYQNGEIVATQPVSLNVEGKSGLNVSINKETWRILGIILLNLVLLIAIIIVARKIMKKS